jgi:hypothetical protein
MGATTRDVQFGWELFKESGYSLSLDEINDRLLRSGSRTISIRMYQHYHKLFRYGYEEYLPINQLDVKTLQNPVWDAAVRNRYAFREVSLEVELRLIHRRRFISFRGLATRISDAIVVVRISGPEAEEVAAAKIKASDQRTEVIFRDSGEILSGVIQSVYAETQNELVIFRIGFSDVGSVEALSLRRPIGMRKLRVEISPRRTDVYFADLVQSLYWLFQAIEAARAAGDEILLELDESNEFTLPAARVNQLSLQSPLYMELIASAPAILLVLAYTRRLMQLRTEYHEGTLVKERVHSQRATTRKTVAEARIQEAVATRLESENAQREASASVDGSPIVAQADHLIRNLLAAEGVTPGTPKPTSEKILNVLDSQVRPALISLIDAAGEAEMTFETDPDIEGELDSRSN